MKVLPLPKEPLSWWNRLRRRHEKKENIELEWEDMIKLKDKGYHSEDILRFLNPHGKIADLGCGRGRHAEYFTKRGFSVTGVDISQEALNQVNPIVKTVLADATNLPFEDGEYDAVLCSEVLEHLAEPIDCVKEVHRVLKPGGVAVFTSPSLNIPKNILIPLCRKLMGISDVWAREHLHVFSTKRYKPLFNLYSKVVSTRHVGFLPILENRLGIGYGLDKLLSTLSGRIPCLYRFSSGVWLKVQKEN